jgi:hypothetical protein
MDSMDKLLSKMELKEVNGLDIDTEMEELTGYLKLIKEEEDQISEKKDNLGATREICMDLINTAEKEMKTCAAMVSGHVPDVDVPALREQCLRTGNAFDLLSEDLAGLYGSRRAHVPELDGMLRTKLDAVSDEDGAVRCMREYAACGLRTLELLKNGVTHGQRNVCAVMGEYLFTTSFGFDMAYNIFVQKRGCRA